MKMQITTATLLASLFLFSCADKKAVVSTTDAPAAPPVERSTNKGPRFGGPGRTDTLFFSMERTPCFGQCKAYRIKVYRSGYATFEGRAHVELEGMHQGRVGRDTMEVLLKEAENAGFFELNDTYDSNVTDLPSSIIQVIGAGKDKRVLARVGTPTSFKVLFEKAEGVLFPIAWRPLPAQE